MDYYANKITFHLKKFNNSNKLTQREPTITDEEDIMNIKNDKSIHNENVRKAINDMSGYYQ
jgi:hypothetical protein